MKVGIIGYGFVGKALADGIHENVELKLIDPLLKTNIKDLITFKPEIVFICVPTPMNSDGTQDVSILESVISDIKNTNIKDLLVVLKSTVLPSYICKISEKLHNLVINPEFLREKYASEDFINSELMLFGGKKIYTEKVSKFYKDHTMCKNQNHILVDLISASLIKYTINSFLATKVIFFNEINNIFNNSGSKESWTNFTNAIASDKRIGESHMQVPGHDQRYGFGGACFPKDTLAFVEYSKSIGSEFKLLNEVILLNNKIREEYNDLTDREISQNISFNKKIEE